MGNYQDLEVWRKAHSLVLVVYKVTSSFPASERYGITAQLRRAAVSVPANIAEGTGRGSDGDFARFLQIARGSLWELQYLLLLALDLDYLDPDPVAGLQAQGDEVGRMLIGLVGHLRTRNPTRRERTGRAPCPTLSRLVTRDS
jgi:four helix bundle protein